MTKNEKEVWLALSPSLETLRPWMEGKDYIIYDREALRCGKDFSASADFFETLQKGEGFLSEAWFFDASSVLHILYDMDGYRAAVRQRDLEREHSAELQKLTEAAGDYTLLCDRCFGFEEETGCAYVEALLPRELIRP